MEFGRGEEFRPLVWVVCTEDAEVGFYFLIGSFSLPISLRMISSGKVDIISEDSSEFLGEGRRKLWATVGDKNVMKSKTFEHVVKQELSNSICVNSF